MAVALFVLELHVQGVAVKAEAHANWTAEVKVDAVSGMAAHGAAIHGTEQEEEEDSSY
jgi:hypothetical protein